MQRPVSQPGPAPSTDGGVARTRGSTKGLAGAIRGTLDGIWLRANGSQPRAAGRAAGEAARIQITLFGGRSGRYLTERGNVALSCSCSRKNSEYLGGGGGHRHISPQLEAKRGAHASVQASCGRTVFGQ